MTVVRIFGISFVILTLIYFCLLFYLRAGEKSRLDHLWYEGAQDIPKDEFIRRGLVAYDKSFRKKLIWGVYILPLATLGGIFGAAQWL